MATPGIAAGAYARMAQVANPASAVNRTIGGGADKDQSFGAVLKDALAAVREAGASSDAKAQAMVTGANKANIVDVVTAVAETEAAVNTLVSVRDKVVAAYEQIMQMPI
jgi:flagellar hook-basal body complex protein FliE